MRTTRRRLDCQKCKHRSIVGAAPGKRICGCPKCGALYFVEALPLSRRKRVPIGQGKRDKDLCI